MEAVPLMFRMTTRDQVDNAMIEKMFGYQLESCSIAEREIVIAFLVDYIKELFSLLVVGYFETDTAVPLVGGLAELRSLLMRNVQFIPLASHIGIGVDFEKAKLLLRSLE